MKRLTLPHPELDGLVLPVVVTGVGVLFGRHVGGVRLPLQCKTDRLTLDIGLCLVLSLLATGPKEPNRLGPVACFAIESCLWPAFEPTIHTLKHPGTPFNWKPDAKCPT